MALSQKHPGLMFVPWFNSHEWKYVYDCLVSNNKDQNDQGLAILKIWKQRTSKLPSGVEGTLILLEALWEDSTISCSQRRCNSYSSALLRFLNVCGAKSDKQGTFYQTAKKNKIPDWVIDLRHTVAHGSQLPAERHLYYCLRQCFKWVLDIYWTKQNQILMDYIKEEINIAELIIDLYCSIRISSFLNNGVVSIKELTLIDNTLQEKIFNFESNCSTSLNLTIEDGQNLLLSTLKAVLADCEDENAIQEVAQMIIKYLCSEILDLNIPDDLPEEQISMWKYLIDFLSEEKILLTLIWELLKYCGTLSVCEANSNSIKLASLWLKFIFNDLNVKRCSDTSNNTAKELGVTKTAHYMDVAVDLQHLELAAVSNCNKFTHIYLGSLLRFGGYSQTAINNKLKEITQNKTETESKIQMFDWNEVCKDTIIVDSSNTRNGPDCASEPSVVFSSNNAEELPSPKLNTRCKLLKDSSMFANCPLGVLPTQNRNYNPLISFLY